MPHPRTSTLLNSPSNRLRLRAQDGASAVEFAILTPLVFMIVFGMLSGALAWNQKQVLSHAAREAARFGATYSVADFDVWADQVLIRVREEAFNGMWPRGKYGYICVAYQDADGVWTYKTQQGTDPDGTPPATSAAGNGSCGLNDNRPADERHLQVLVMEDVFFNAVLVSGDVRLQSSALARHEVSS